VGTGFNVLAGPVELQVMREDREEAVALLAELTEDAGEEGLKEDGEEGGKVEIPASGDTLPGESPSNLLRTFRTAWWRRPIWIVPFILAAAGIIIAVVGTRKPRPIALPTPDLPATIFQSEAVGFFYKLVWAAEGGSSTHFPTVRSTSVVAANDSVLLEEWVVERSDGVIYYPVYALARNESAWVLGVGVAQDSMVTQSAVPRLRRRVAGVREP
jgi:hypothetical protein